MSVLAPHIRRALLDYPPMARSVERDVAILAKQGDPRARDLLVICNLGFALKRAHRYLRPSGPALDDLFGYAVLGLLRATEKYDPARGYRFVTYAGEWVNAYLDEGVGMKEQLVRTASTRSRLYGRSGHRVDPMKVIYLDAPTGETGDSTLHQVLPAATPPADEEMQREQQRAGVRKCLEHGFTPRELDIINSRLMLDEQETLNVIGLRHGVTRERIRQIEKMLLPRLRRRLKHLAA